jgi:hypothetical protein
MLFPYRWYVKGEYTVPKYLIEREIPGAGAWSAEELRAVSQKSVGVLREMGPAIQWVHSYVVDDKVYCVYNAETAAMVKEHARCAGFPVNRIAVVSSIIDPVTAEP